MLGLFNTTLKKILIIVTVIFGFELLSFNVHLIPDFRNIIFLVISLLFLVVGVVNLRYAFWVLLIELIISSKGYLFYFEGDGLVLPIRISFWLILMGLWMANFIISITNKKKTIQESAHFFKSSYINYIMVLGFFILVGLFNGYLSDNFFEDIFFDFNAWLYLLLILPAYDVLAKDTGFRQLRLVFMSSVIWVCLKTFIFLYLFSHSFSFLPALYRWIRVSGVGEITQIQEGFYRIFFQSHLFVLVAIFLLLSYIFNKSSFKNSATIYERIAYLFGLSSLISVIAITLSRSFWVGVVGGIITFFIICFIFYKLSFKRFVGKLIYLLVTFALSIFIIVSIVKFPYPNKVGDYNAASLLVNRAKIENSEAAVSSRWALLPVLWGEIIKVPITGNGFGSTVTYVSSDPRVREASPGGIYTTYAFEWGWLDIWYKIGLFGVVAYLALLGKLLIDAWVYMRRGEGFLVFGLFLALVSVIIINIFSPYFNHPLGIGFLIILIILYDFNLSKVQASS